MTWRGIWEGTSGVLWCCFLIGMLSTLVCSICDSSLSCTLRVCIQVFIGMLPFSKNLTRYVIKIRTQQVGACLTAFFRLSLLLWQNLIYYSIPVVWCFLGNLWHLESWVLCSPCVGWWLWLFLKSCRTMWASSPGLPQFFLIDRSRVQGENYPGCYSSLLGERIVTRAGPKYSHAMFLAEDVCP